MQSGLIHKLAVMPANETDAQGMKRVCRSKAQTMSTRVTLPRCTYSVAPCSAIKGCGGGLEVANIAKILEVEKAQVAAGADQPNAFLHARLGSDQIRGRLKSPFEGASFRAWFEQV